MPPGAAAGESTIGGTPPSWREGAAVFAVLAAAHLFLWSRSLPLAYQDLSFYFEPAILLAREGWLAGPASHYHDLTYVRGMYFYPPGFPLVLAGWIAVFGVSAASFLGFTNIVHLLYLFALWGLLRVRVGCGRWASALTVVSAFPFFNHGRPDLTALLFGALAWFSLPRRSAGPRLVLPGVLLGLAVLVSPPFGISSAAAVGAYLVLDLREPIRRRAVAFGILTAVAVAIFAGIWAAVLTWQGAWAYGIEQFMVNSRVRAAELNRFPGYSPYLLVFTLIPLGLFTLVPAVAGLLSRRGRADRRLRDTAAAYLTGFAVWFALSKAPLLTGGHFAYLGRAPLHASLASARGVVGIFGIGILLVVTAVHGYLQKDTWIALAQGHTGYEEAARGIALPPESVVGLDSDAFPLFYRPASSVTYELMGFDYWRRTREETSAETLAALDLQSCTGPVIPDVVVVSSRTLLVFGPPDPALFAPAGGVKSDVQRATLLGREIRFPRDPGKLHVFKRRWPAGETGRRPGCRLLARE